MSRDGCEAGGRRSSSRGVIDDAGVVGSRARRPRAFREVLQDRHPAQIIAAEILNRTGIISEHPQLGRLIDGRQDYRELVLPVLNTTYERGRYARFHRHRGAPPLALPEHVLRWVDEVLRPLRTPAS